MRKTIYKNMCTLISIMLIACALLIAGVCYTHFHKSICDNIKNQAYITAAYLNGIAGSYDYAMLEEMYSEAENMRVTLIGADGTVKFDNDADIAEMENHSKRPEVIEALNSGAGECERYSDTINETIYYYAVRLDNGDVFRLSKTNDSIINIFIYIEPYLIIIVIIMLIISFISAGKITDSIMKPINSMDTENINMDNIVYEELQPFFARIINENKEKEKTEKIRREFSANVSHELKTPLTAIYGYAQMINNGMAQSKEDIYNFTGKIEKESSRLILLVNDIIKLSHLDEDNMHTDDTEVLDLNEMTKEIMAGMEEYAEKKNVKLYYSGETAKINGSRTLISELVYNLLDNAIKYNKEKGSVNVVVGNLADSVEISVRDTGIGIVDEDKERIFERFYRVDKSHSKKVGGTGLGLSIVKHVAMCHDANITVDSKIGEGTVISVNFKRAE